MAFLGLTLGPNLQYSPFSQQLYNTSLAQWNQAMGQFYPIEQQAINFAEDPRYAEQQAQKAQQNVQQQFGTQQAQSQQQLEYMGLSPTAAQQASLSKQSKLSESASEAGAANTAREQAKATQMGLLAGA